MKSRLTSAPAAARRRAGRLARKAFLAAAQRFSPAVVLPHPAGLFVLPSDDLTIRSKLFLNGTRSDFIVLDRAVATLTALGHPTAGGTLVDVGANLGTTTLAGVQIHGFGHVVACEPEPRNVAFLRATVALNGLQDVVTVVQAAVADVAGSASFEVRPAGRAGRTSGVGKLAVTSRGNLVEVEVTSLDALVGRGLIRADETALVWLDVQGHEAHALAGGRRLLAAGVPVVTAVRRKRLERAGGLDRFEQIVTDSFVEFVDLRAPNLKPGWSPQRRPIVEFRALLGRPRSTDVLLLS